VRTRIFFLNRNHELSKLKTEPVKLEWVEERSGWRFVYDCKPCKLRGGLVFENKHSHDREDALEFELVVIATVTITGKPSDIVEPCDHGRRVYKLVADARKLDEERAAKLLNVLPLRRKT
jgi:hypothetical protein